MCTRDMCRGQGCFALVGTRCWINVALLRPSLLLRLSYLGPELVFEPRKISLLCAIRLQALPAYSSFASVDAFPSLESLGLRKGQVLWLQFGDPYLAVA